MKKKKKHLQFVHLAHHHVMDIFYQLHIHKTGMKYDLRSKNKNVHNIIQNKKDMIKISIKQISNMMHVNYE